MRYTEEEKQFMIRYVPGHSYREIQEEFSRRFWQISVSQIKSFVGNYHLNTGRNGRFQKGDVPWNRGRNTGHTSPETEFKTGHMPHNHKPVGTEVVDSYGYVKVKVAEPKSWRFKHHMVWEQHHGEIPRGYRVAFRDGNKSNLDINNLVLVSKAMILKMNQYGISGAAEAFDAAVLVAKISQERTRRKKK